MYSQLHAAKCLDMNLDNHHLSSHALQYWECSSFREMLAWPADFTCKLREAFALTFFLAYVPAVYDFGR